MIPARTCPLLAQGARTHSYRQIPAALLPFTRTHTHTHTHTQLQPLWYLVFSNISVTRCCRGSFCPLPSNSPAANVWTSQPVSAVPRFVWTLLLLTIVSSPLDQGCVCVLALPAFWCQFLFWSPVSLLMWFLPLALLTSAFLPPWWSEFLLVCVHV